MALLNMPPFANALIRLGVQAAMLIAVALLTACAFNPPKETQLLCPHCRAIPISPADELPLIAYVSGHPSVTESAYVHVYLEGDGQPWIHGRWPAENPSSRTMTALRLMLLDPNPSIYLNRPCYGYKTVPPPCSAALWTNARYGPEVVDSMALALQELTRSYPDKRWVLIGHSGGGALAMLLAGRVENVAAVVTLAANLDHKAWTEAKGFAPLDGSLNPIDEVKLPAHIIRWHFAGGRDHQVPAPLTATAAERDPDSRFFLESEFDHGCCWREIWPQILQELGAQLTGTK